MQDTLVVDIRYEPRRSELPNSLGKEGSDDNLPELASVGSVELEPVRMRPAHEAAGGLAYNAETDGDERSFV